MPTYDYECQACGHAFERYQEMSARKLRTCPDCGKRRLVRLVGKGAGVIFKGSGFYETDYKRAAAKPNAAAPTSAKTEATKSEAGKTDGAKSEAGKTDGAKKAGKTE